MITTLPAATAATSAPERGIPITVVLPADLAGAYLQDLLVRNGVAPEITIELPRDTRCCELQDFAHREGLLVSHRQGQILLSHPRRRSLTERLRHLLCRPQAF